MKKKIEKVMTGNFKEKLEKMKYKKIMVTCTNSE